jgi:hypothetical protein
MKALSEKRMASIEAGTRCSRMRYEYLQAMAKGNFMFAFILAMAMIGQGCGPFGS